MVRPTLCLIGVAAALSLAVGARAQALPDWSGAWQMNGNTVFDHSTVTPANGAAGLPGTREAPPYNAEWQARYEARIKLVAADRSPDPVTTCGTPAGYPRALNAPDAYEFVVRPEQVWIISENGPNIVRVYTDGRTHPPADEVWPTYTGDSIGHWEGDTLVFDTIGLKGGSATIIDRTGIAHSDELHVVTRMRRLDDKTMEAQFVLTDPVAFTRPWTARKTYRKLAVGSRVYDYACAENNRNIVTANGKTLTLGTDGKPIDKDR